VSPSQPASFVAALDQTLAEAAGRAAILRHSRGKLQRAAGTLLRATGVRAEVGELCELRDPQSDKSLHAEVVGFDGDALLLSPMGPMQGLSAGTQVLATGARHCVPVGPFLLGRVMDGMGLEPLDDGPALPEQATRCDVLRAAPAALGRRPIAQPLPLGVRAIDSLLTCGVGQRVGIFAPAGCGKSTLLAMLCRHARVDVVVAALVGERGREVGDFIHEALGAQALERSVLVVATSDRPSAERLKAPFVATAYAEYFAAQGQQVLLLVDSVTRLARAAREIGLSAGEPPARRGYPPSVFTLLPQLFERAGCMARGSITAFYTVLEETDDGSDPVSEEVRSLLDGHIVLSRKLAARGHFPAIDVLRSASRLFGRVADTSHQGAARRLRDLMSKYEDVELLLRIGEYQRGSDALADIAVERHDQIDAFLRQQDAGGIDFGDALRGLRELTS